MISFVADRIYTSVYVCHVIVVEATEYMDNSVCLTDIGKELVSQSFTLTCTFYQSGDIYDFYGCRNNPLGMYQFCQRIQTFIGNGNYTYIGSIVQKGKFAACAFAFDKQLKSVDLPTFGSPTIPHCNAILIYYFFYYQ